MASSFPTDPAVAGQNPSNESPARRGSEILELVAILLAVSLADITIYRGHGYAGLAAFFSGVLGLLCVGKRRRQLHWAAWIVGGMLTLLAIRLLWYGSPLQVIAGFVLVIAFATTLDGQQPLLLAVVAMGSQAIAGGCRALGEYLVDLRCLGPRVHRPGILNVVLPALACLAFSALFVLANPDVVSFVSRQLEALLTELSEWFIRMALRPTEPIFWLAVAVVMAGLLKPILRFSPAPSFAPPKVDGDWAMAPLFSAYRNTLVTVIALFAVYLAYEFHTLWTRDFPTGFYYSGYAHEGAAWLTVALALATLILSLVFSGRVLKDSRLPKLRLLAWIWSLENLLLSLSVYNRLFIYIDFNGMTRMRIVGLFGISVVVAGFLLVVWKIAREKDFAWLIHRQVWALAVATYLFAITPVDGIAASYNVRRILDGDISAAMQIGVHKLDLEGVLALPPLLDSSTPEIRDGVAALIADRYLQLQNDRKRRQQAGWTAFQLSEKVALERLSALSGRWKLYENDAKRHAAVKRFYEFAYQWY